MDFLQSTARFFEREVGADFKTKTYLLAVSGGLDSMVLLETFARLMPAGCFHVAHFNHATRETSARDEQAVIERSGKLGVRCETGRSQGPSHSEAALREERLRFLTQAKGRTQADFIVTAHHADDQLETFLMRLLRGSGIDGLGAMRAAADGWLRPFLGLSKKALETQALLWGVRFHEDETNATDLYFRNRLRHQVMGPLRALCREYGGAERFFERFGTAIEELQWVSDELHLETARRYAQIVEETVFWSRFARSGFLALDPQWQRRLLRRICARLGVDVLDRPALETLREAIATGVRGHCAPGVVLRISCDQAFIQSASQRARFESGVCFAESQGMWECGSLGFSLGRVAEAFPGAQARFFRPGDHSRLGKLKTLWLEQRIPQPERRLIPIVALPGSDEVLWQYPEPHPLLSWRGPSFRFSFGPVAEATGPKARTIG